MIPRALLICLLGGAAALGAAAPPTPSFYARRDYAGLYSNWVQVADTNGDGVPDLIAANEGYIEVLLGNGQGTFSPGPATHTVIGYAPSFAATDLNGDGKVDLVMAGAVTVGGDKWGIGVSLGNGDGTFQTGVFYAAGTNAYEETAFVAVGDFNGDGIPDVVTPGASGIWLFTGKGDGTFNPGVLTVSLPTQAGGKVAAADFNGDGKLDLVVTLPTANGFFVLFGNGNGTFQNPLAFAQPSHVGVIAVGSLTKGGHPSIALSSGTTAYLYFGNGTGAFSGPKLTDLPGGGVVIGDVNGDGIPDLVSAGVYIALGNGNGTFKKPIYYPIEGLDIPDNVVLADLRNNGLADIVTDSDAAVSVLLSLGKGKYQDGESIPVTGGAGCGAAADYNGDGKPDLAVNNSQAVTILLGTGKSASPFATGATIPLSGAACVVTGDLNGDGIPDLLVPMNGSPNSLLAYLGKGDGTFTLVSTTPTPNSGGYVVLADFNHDGKLDFATSGNLLALGNGDGTFQTPVPIISNPPFAGFSNIAAGDINNDGWPDLVLTTNVSAPPNNLYVLLNSQKGGFTQAPTTFGADTIQAVLVHLNGDRNLDLVLSYEAGGGAWVYLGNGRGGFTQQAVLVDPLQLPGVVMVADINGDGIPDIGVLESDTLAIYLGEGGATYEPPFYIGTGPSPASILTENLHGQSPTAGIPDIVAPDLSGEVVVLINKTK